MSEEPNKVEMTEQPAEVEPETEQQDAAEVGGDDFDKERAMATIKKLREFEKKAKALEKQVSDYEAKEKERRDAELSEIERTKQQLAEAQEQVNSLRKEQMRAKVAKEVGLPDVIAERIQGDDEETMLEDAKRLAEALPKPKPMSVTNPGAVSKGETDDQRRARIWGSGANIFDPAAAREQGGGVIEREKI